MSEIHFCLYIYSGDEQQLVDAVNAPDNSTFVVNTVNLVANLSDVLITAVGGLLPLLSAATTSAVRTHARYVSVKFDGTVMKLAYMEYHFTKSCKELMGIYVSIN